MNALANTSPLAYWQVIHEDVFYYNLICIIKVAFLINMFEKKICMKTPSYWKM